MAVTSPAPARRPRQRLFWSRLHFGIRLLGLTGAFLACVCAVFAGVSRQLDSVYGTATLRGAVEAAVDLAQKTVQDPSAAPVLVLLLGGAAAALLALIVELLAVVAFTATRRSAFGINALVQGALAAVLLIGINVWSFSHYEHIDCTRDRIYTLPEEDRANLTQLDPKSQTTVIVYEMHRTFGRFTEKPDSFDNAAESKVVEKVRELADQLREVGPQLRVENLVVGEGYENRLDELTRDAPELRKAIESAPENSLFFFARGEDGREHIQRLSFNDFYLLDKTASRADANGRRNLVLLSQGVEPFVRRILSLGAPKPRIGIAVIHDVLTTAGEDEFGLQGLRKVLEEHGFEVRDILLKRWPSFGPPQAAAYTPDESALDEVEQEEQALKGLVSALEQDQQTLHKALDVWKKAINDEKTREELTRRYASRLRGNKITAEIARAQVEDIEDEVNLRDLVVKRYREQLADTAKRKSKLNVAALTEQRRMTDLRAKMDRLLADCDVLFVPRMTLRNTASRGANIPASLYRMEKEQVDAIKDFLKAGKPLLACLGPTNPEPESRSPESNQPEPMEIMLRELGIKLGKQTVLFDVEQKAFAERRAGKQFAGNTIRIPPVLFDWKAGQGHPLGYPVLSSRENPIRHSLRLASRGLGKGQALDIVLRLPRPVYYEPPPGVKPDFDPDFLMSDADSWNEDQPFPTAESIPQFTRPKESRDEMKPASADPLDERRRGPFPIGVAVQEELPKSWYASEADNPAKVRLAVVGQGGFFTGKDMPPAQEKLFVNTINWLLGRDDQLPRDDKVWSYPRVSDTIPPDSQTEYLWLWGVRLGLPVLFLYLGLIVLLFRRLR